MIKPQITEGNWVHIILLFVEKKTQKTIWLTQNLIGLNVSRYKTDFNYIRNGQPLKN